MALSEEKLKEYNKRLILSRMRILINNGFYGLLLMHMILTIDESCKTASTDGYRIYFGPKFMDEISDNELDFVMMHEILHVALRHCARTDDRDAHGFNIACDIVVNSNILRSCDMDPKSITLKKYGELMHLTPKGDEGHNYTAEEVYEMLPKRKYKVKKGINGSEDTPHGGGWDDHSRWKFTEDDSELKELWQKRIADAAESISIKHSTKSYGGMPMFAHRLLKELKEPQVDWRKILQDFIQSEVNDYSFTPPDRRFEDCDFFLPDYNEKDEWVDKIWFLIDTSGSIGDDAMSAAYSEICSAINQFNGKLKGMLSFTEGYVTDPIPFETIESLMEIKPVGGGGNDFAEIFRYMKKNMADDLPAYVIIITDGYDIFPEENDAMGVPVLWLINNEDVIPPWGKTARIKI